YSENDGVRPLGVYGMSKVEAERRTLQIHPKALVIRTSAFFSPWDQHNFVFSVVRDLTRAIQFVAANDVVVSPTYVPDLVNACLDLLIDGASGIWHMANDGQITWYDLAQAIAEKLGLDHGLLKGKPANGFGWAALRPSYSALTSDRGNLLPTLNNALDRFAITPFLNFGSPETKQGGPQAESIQFT
ncbi:MAG TPA: sugar nucleotide-binding protein, partial [Pirellula sp.]|nr:sugar nucleotide-binding protein [Pirellula sp.]